MTKEHPEKKFEILEILGKGININFLWEHFLFFKTST